MYRFSCGKYSNDDAFDLAMRFPQKRDRLLSLLDRTRLQWMIFHEQLDERAKRNVEVGLTCGDLLRVPLPKSLCEALFFALQVNTNPSVAQQNRIHGPHQMTIMFQVFDGDPDQVAMEPTVQRLAFTKMDVQHPSVLPGYTLRWHIPVSWFRNGTGGSSCALGWNSFGKLELFGEEVKIPRSLLLPWFGNSLQNGRLSGDDSQAVKDAFDATNADALRDVFNFLGLHSVPGLQSLTMPNGPMLVRDGHIIAYPLDGVMPQDDNYDAPLWEEAGGSGFVLLPRLDYVPVCMVPGDPREVRLYIL